jgi:hypothetical protein
MKKISDEPLKLDDEESSTNQSPFHTSLYVTHEPTPNSCKSIIHTHNSDGKANKSGWKTYKSLIIPIK